MRVHLPRIDHLHHVKLIVLLSPDGVDHAETTRAKLLQLFKVTFLGLLVVINLGLDLVDGLPHHFFGAAHHSGPLVVHQAVNALLIVLVPVIHRRITDVVCPFPNLIIERNGARY